MEKHIKQAPEELVNQFAEIQIITDGFYITIGADDFNEAKYKCAQIAMKHAEDENRKLVESIKELNNVCGTVNFSSHNQMREAIELVVEMTDELLKQYRE